MQSMPRVRRSFVALSAVAVLTAGAACSSEPSNDADDSAEVTPSSETEDTDTSGVESDAAIPLSEEVSPDDPAAWGLPVVDGWSVPQEVDPGIFQISKDGSETLVTAYQLKDASSSDAEQGARAWLEKYHSVMARNPQASDVSDPSYDTTQLDTTQGPMEFVVQEMTYTSPGGTYRTWSAARWIDGHLFALQYAAPEDEWSADEWTQLSEEGLKLTL